MLNNKKLGNVEEDSVFQSFVLRGEELWSLRMHWQGCRRSCRKSMPYSAS